MIQRETASVAGSELAEEADVVLDEQADVVDAVLAHGDPLDAEAEGPAGVFFGVDAARLEDVGVDHPAAAELDPLAAVFEPDVHLGRRLGEGEEAGAEPDFGVRAEVGLYELHHRAL